MIEFFSVGQRAEGIIAIGQEATGIIAIGQFATGVFALGQVARGGIAIGQVAIGVVAVGMLSLGLVYSVGMIGAGARGLGGILPLVPTPPRRAKLPGLANPDAIRGGRETGWLPVRVGSSSHGPVLSHASGPIHASHLSVGAARACKTAAKTANTEFLGLFGPGHGGPELRRLMRITDPTMLVGPARIAAGVGQLVLLAVACGMFFQFVAVPIGDFALTTLRFLVTGA
jgi:hypothetical protein